VYLCRFTGVELFKNKEKIRKYSKLSEEQIVDAYQLLVENTKAISEYEIPVEVYMQAEKLCEGVDPKDTVYVAAALFLDAHLWTGDKVLREGLVKKGFIHTISTSELLEKD
jgi:predicted nucleic acid-binding protein